MTAEEFTGGIAFEAGEEGDYTIKKKGEVVGSIIKIAGDRYSLSIFMNNETLGLKTFCKTRAVNIALQFIRYEPEN